MCNESAARGHPYRLQRRLDSMAATRERITRATFELHREVGPARTTISGIAQKAGVQRHTVYRHFPDLVSLIRACTAHSLHVTGMPDPEAWSDVAAPEQRLGIALRELYAYYRRNEVLLGNVLRDMAVMPELVQGAAASAERRARMFAVLTDGWRLAPDRQRRAEAAIAHALEFATWRSLTTRGLSDAEACDAMTSFVRSMAAA